MSHEQTYTAGKAKIHSLTSMGVLLCLAVGGCSQVTMPLGSDDVETPLVLTGSIPSGIDVAFTDIDGKDRQIIAFTLDLLTSGAVPKQETDDDHDARLSWTNPESGNSGKVSDVDQQALAETGCLTFKTTANTIAGVRIYSGTACRDISRQLTITSLAAGDA